MRLDRISLVNVIINNIRFDQYRRATRGPVVGKEAGEMGNVVSGIARGMVALGVSLGVAYAVWVSTRPGPLIVQGEVTAERVDISPRVSGRVAKLNVDVGGRVERGAVIAELENPQLIATLETARAALAVARADLARVVSVRTESVEARRADLAAADADVTLYREVWERKTQLQRSGNAAQQVIDESSRNLDAARRKREAADAALRLTVAGASAEERALYAAQARSAETVVAQRQADVDELIIRAPITGEVTTKVAEIGENFSAGSPLVSMVDAKNTWFTFNLREDLLRGLKAGDEFETTVPALGSVKIRARVTVINVEGQYATWRATRATGDFDLKTFEVRAAPVDPISGLRPGMSAIVRWDEAVGR